ncbi:MarR family transcriptional regulator [Anaerotignum lactatifermentans]|uniref:MarR family transcriptional regulator n=1 Tax=Anaerotignum lactatifermentans TaxID=160404 RepID=A0ABS2GAZ0_9FIRM|nr:MarR family transcriptional regulator [Anaerotignum lactatifermentans]MBM6829425.1 MarR family transcriptional regulator [Anaerotignum lactatifermentans]MBM6877783.1 MarR family transcriptional regulator [Anaerotignum lactatifermentans]MBM6951002.1 MarR family transcriptional regulator [Anaerotignum lactatifermentans]
MQDKTILLLNRVVHRFFRELDNRTSQKLNENITGQNMMVIGYLAHSSEPVYQKDLEEHFSIRRSTVSKVLRLMEEKGMIERRAVSADARLKQILLMQRGREIHQTSSKIFHDLTRKMYEGISEQEKEALCQILEKMEKNLCGKEPFGFFDACD